MHYASPIALLILLISCGAVESETPSVPIAAEAQVSLHLDKPQQVIDNFGASDAWSMQFLEEWPVDARNQLADLLFSIERGIGLSCWRFNIGAGKMPQDILDPLRTVECFEIAPGQYDWTRQACAQWFLSAAKARGVEQFVAFANSPPARLTRNGLTRCSDDGGSTNLKLGSESDYARFLVDVIEYFQTHPDSERRVLFDWVSPVNEPQWEWKDPVQEGNRASNNDLLRIIGAVNAELRGRKLETRILAPESGTLQAMRLNHANMQRSYGEPYGKYFDLLCKDAHLAEALGNVVASHAYWIDSSERVSLRIREAFQRELRRHPDWRFWQTEFCVMEGGRDLTMNTALKVATTIHNDLVHANASAWHWWLAVSPHDFKDGLIYTNYRKPGDSWDILPAKTMWALGNYSRYIRPGYHRIDAAVKDSGDALRISAFSAPDSNHLVVVAINSSNQQMPCTLATDPVRKIQEVSVNCTDDTRSLEPVTGISPSTISFPPRSVISLLVRLRAEP